MTASQETLSDDSFSALKTFQSLPRPIQERLVTEDTAPIVYNLDAIVSSFLKKHDVFIVPPSQGPGIDLSDRMLFAVAGPVAMVNAGIKNQSKVAKQAEWTSWKQWTLNHKDFNEYKESSEARAERCNSKFNLWRKSEEATNIFKEVKSTMSSHKQEQRKNLILLFYAILAMSVLAVAVGSLLRLIEYKLSEIPVEREETVVPSKYLPPQWVTINEAEGESFRYDFNSLESLPNNIKRINTYFLGSKKGYIAYISCQKLEYTLAGDPEWEIIPIGSKIQTLASKGCLN